MNVEIGTEAPQFPEKEYTNGIFVAVYSLIRESATHRLTDTESWRLPDSLMWGVGESTKGK